MSLQSLFTISENWLSLFASKNAAVIKKDNAVCNKLDVVSNKNDSPIALWRFVNSFLKDHTEMLLSGRKLFRRSGSLLLC